MCNTSIPAQYSEYPNSEKMEIPRGHPWLKWDWGRQTWGTAFPVLTVHRLWHPEAQKLHTGAGVDAVWSHSLL